MLNHILNDDSHKMKFAVIENEFGEVGIDEKVLSESVDEEVIEVMNGCICCTVRGDLVEALKRLYNRVETFDGIIIETTGLADPAPVVQTFFIDDDIQGKYKLDSVITLVDTKHIMERLDEVKPEGVENEAVEQVRAQTAKLPPARGASTFGVHQRRASTLALANLDLACPVQLLTRTSPAAPPKTTPAAAQVAFADRIILNKVDLAEDEGELDAIEARLRKMNPSAMVHRCSYSKVHPKELLGIDAFSLDRVLEMDPEFLDPDQEHEHDPSVVSAACKIDGEVNVQMLSQWISRLISKEGANLYRYKGVIAVAGEDEKFVFQGVGMLFSGTFDKVKWKEGEKRESRFVFIGKNLDMEYLKKTFEACRVGTNLRFPVGTPVMASVEGGRMPGKILKQWDDGNAYRIKLDDGVECWAPVDVDYFVCAAA